MPLRPEIDGDGDAVVARLRAAGCVWAEDEAALLRAEAASAQDLHDKVTLRCSGTPLEQVLGWAEVSGVRVTVGPRAFVPRRRTELLIAEALALGRADRSFDVVVDLCCGTGVIGLAIAEAFPGVELHAVDVDPLETALARLNLATVRAHVYDGDLYDALPPRLRGTCDLVVASPPYVPTAALALMPAEARVHEPAIALDGGPDGLLVAERIVAAAGQWLRPGGHALVECSRAQAEQLAAGVEAAGLEPRVVTDDDLDATVVVARRVQADA